MPPLIDSLAGSGVQQQGRDGRWYIAHPILSTSLLDRVRQAWAVLRGRAEAVRFHDQMESTDGR